jgi:hypothetical protein
MWEIGASGWFYYKEVYYDVRSHECNETSLHDVWNIYKLSPSLSAARMHRTAG